MASGGTGLRSRGLVSSLALIGSRPASRPKKTHLLPVWANCREEGKVDRRRLLLLMN